MQFVKRFPKGGYIKWCLVGNGDLQQLRASVDLPKRIESLQAVDNAKMAERLKRDVQEWNAAHPPKEQLIEAKVIASERLRRIRELEEAQAQLTLTPQDVECVEMRKIIVPAEGNADLASADLTRLAKYRPTDDPRGTWYVDGWAEGYDYFDTPDGDMQPGQFNDEFGEVCWKPEGTMKLLREKIGDVVVVRNPANPREALSITRKRL